MKCVKCLNSCFWYLSLKLGAYIISSVFLLTSVTISVMVLLEIANLDHVLSHTLKALLVVMASAHVVLFLSACCLLYGLCMEKTWPLLAFIPITVVIAINELAIIAYLIINKDWLPYSAIKTAASQIFVLVAVIFSAVEVFSLYVQWQEDKSEGRRFSRAIG